MSASDRGDIPDVIVVLSKIVRVKSKGALRTSREEQTLNVIKLLIRLTARPHLGLGN